MSRIVTGGRFVLAFWMIGLIGCKSLKPGECKTDTDCRGQVQGVPVCYKEPTDAELGRCMTVRQARAAQQQYKRRLNGKCEDQDGDGVKAGDACDPPVDCDDRNPRIRPGALEVCDSKDNNCDGVINEGLKKCVGTVLGGKQEPVVHLMTSVTAGAQVAPNGDLWVSDQHRIYRIDSSRKVQLVAGSSKPGMENQQGPLARFHEPRGMAVASDGTVYITECRNNCVRKLAADGQVSVYAGKCSSRPDDTGLDKDGPWSEARFWCPIDIAFDLDGSLLVADMRNSKIKRINKERRVQTVAGKGGHKDKDGYVVFGFANGPALKAEFDHPAGLAVGSDGMVYIADMKNNCIRYLKRGKVKTFAGVCANGSDKGGYRDGPSSKARFRMPNSVDIALSGAVVVADTHNHCIRKVQNGKVTTLTGTAGSQGYFDGPIQEALFNGPQTVSAAQDGSLYVVDTGNYRVRHVVP